jgi:tetraprenyl-beta-curcumene synthase
VRRSGGVALVTANARYWSSVAPRVRAELRRWHRRALEMPDGAERKLALEKLRNEHFNAEVAATLATLAPRPYRGDAVEAIVALEVLYDYLDGLGEGPLEDPLRDGEQIFQVFLAAVSEDEASEQGGFGKAGDGGYTAELAQTVRAALGRLPNWNVVDKVAEATARRCAEAQVRIHAVPQLGMAPAKEWADARMPGTGLGWRELLAGAASSVLAVHALIAAAADPRTTPSEAEAIAAAYLSIGAAITVLDSLVDREADVAAGKAGFVTLYDDPAALPGTLAQVVRQGAAQARGLRHGGHHVMTVTGAVAYWTTDPGADGTLAAPVAKRVRRELRPLIWPTLVVMRAWRGAKRLRTIVRRRGSAKAPDPVASRS